jgi:hypothetical protein
MWKIIAILCILASVQIQVQVQAHVRLLFTGYPIRNALNVSRQQHANYTYITERDESNKHILLLLYQSIMLVVS